MSHRIRYIFYCFLLISILTSNITCRAASPNLSASAYVLMDADSGRVLCGQNETQEMSIASTTKIMTALVALQHGCLCDEVTVKKAHLKEGSSMYLAEGEKLSMEELLYGLLLPSGNDAAECIADHCGNGTAQFVEWMNDKAAALSMTHSNFTNPSGLDETGHYSCAYDMAILAAEAMKDQTFVRIASTSSASIGSRTMTNHNKLLFSLSGCIGLKTGYTGDAGRTLVTCVQRGDMRLIAVTLNDKNDWKDHAALYDYGFSNYQLRYAAKSGEMTGELLVDGGEKSKTKVVCARSIFYPVLENEQLTRKVSLPDFVAAPVKKGEKLGTITFYLKDQEIGCADLVCSEDIAALPRKTGFADWLVRLLKM